MSLHPKAKDIAPKVQYEWDIFEWISDNIDNEDEDSEQTTQLLMEDFLLHAKVLHDFCIAQPKGDSVSANHFFDDSGVWQETAANLCPYLKANRKRLDKKLPHLTYSRLTEDERWDFVAIWEELSQTWQIFLSELPEPRNHWFQSDVS